MKQSGPNKLAKNARQELTEALVVTLEKVNPDHQILFLSGYLCPVVGVVPETRTVNELRRVLHNLHCSIQEGLISFTNFIQIFVEISHTWKKDDKANKQQTCKKFQQKAQALCGELACSRRYLRQKWFNELKMANSLNSFIKEEENNQRSGLENEDESWKLILKLQEEDKKEQERMNLEKEKESENYLKQLLKEEEEHEKIRKQQMMEIEKQEKENMTCQICLEEIRYTDVGTLSCTHIFHRTCIRGHIEALVQDKKIDIPCPAGCGKNLPLQDIEQYIDGALKQKFEKFCFDIYVQKHDKLVSWCPTPGCTAVFTREGDLDNYRCPVCNKHYCLSCRCDYHRGQSCAEYRINNSYGEDDKKFEQFVRGAKFKQCPKCKYWVERIEGCSTMACRCGHQFCYDCGGSDCPHGMCKNGGGGGIMPIFRGRRR